MSETVLIILVVFGCLVTFFSLAGFLILGYSCFSLLNKLTERNKKISELEKEKAITDSSKQQELLELGTEYREKLNLAVEFLELIIETIKSDTVFLKSEVIKKYGAAAENIPEVRDLNKAILNFENKIEQIQQAVEKYTKELEE